MKVLITGSDGLVGRFLTELLTRKGHDFVPFDILRGQDIRDIETLRSAAAGATHLVHLAALLGAPDQGDTEIFDINVLGTFNVLKAAREAGVMRMVLLSSVNVLGCFMGQSAPDYLPIDDEHPQRSKTAYGTGKRLLETMGEVVAAATGATVVALRAPGVWPPEHYAKQRKWRTAEPTGEFQNWEYGAMIDVRDLADAILQSLEAPIEGFHAMLVVSDRLASDFPAEGSVQRLLPQVPWKQQDWLHSDPFRGLVDCRRARELIGFNPVRNWENGGEPGAR